MDWLNRTSATTGATSGTVATMRPSKTFGRGWAARAPRWIGLRFIVLRLFNPQGGRRVLRLAGGSRPRDKSSALYRRIDQAVCSPQAAQIPSAMCLASPIRLMGPS
jgi:hypothetical protein